MIGQDLKDLRQRAGLGQAEMAQHMGLSHRQYQEVESSAEPLRPLHVRAIGAASMALAVLRKDPGLLTLEALEGVMELAPLLRPIDRARLGPFDIRDQLTPVEAQALAAFEAMLGRRLAEAEVVSYMANMRGTPQVAGLGPYGSAG